MYIIESYSLAVLFCVITMLCWGSWANTQKLAGSNWRFELFYWDYVIGIVLLSLIFGYTLGSNGEYGRSFSKDLFQASSKSYALAFIGGVVFNLANILIVAAIAYAGMSVAFPVGIGLALVLGVLVIYISTQKGDPILLFIGVALVALAIVLDVLAYQKLAKTNQKNPRVGLALALVGSFLMSFFLLLCCPVYVFGLFQSGGRKIHSLWSCLCIFCRDTFKQFYFQYHFDEKTNRRRSIIWSRLFCRKTMASPCWNVGRYHLVCRNVIQYPCCRKGRIGL